MAKKNVSIDQALLTAALQLLVETLESSGSRQLTSDNLSYGGKMYAFSIKRVDQE